MFLRKEASIFNTTFLIVQIDITCCRNFQAMKAISTELLSDDFTGISQLHKL